MNAKTKFGLAILAMAFLVLNPIGACASMPLTSPPAHPCCPTSPVALDDCAKPGCVCINPTPISIPPNSDKLVLVLPANGAPEVSQPAANERPAFALAFFAPADRYLKFHQLLL
jgi:hypothetical protein